MNEGTERASWGLVGRSAAMEHLREKIRRFGPSDLSIHVHGETGTGKDRVARAIHAVSGRRGRFVAFNAAGFTDELVEAELFGHTRGAFTGAVAAREGYVVAAEHGTLFLDEIAELSLRGQAKLLRFLEEHEYQRLGETVVRRADVRVVSATNVDLERRVEEGLFRKDLWYRLQGQRVFVPPLRERGGDVLLLTLHFLGQAVRPGERPPRLSREAERAIARFGWPGNVRQLATEVKRLVVTAAAGVVHLADLSDEVREGPDVARGTWRTVKDDFERRYLGQVLDRNRGNRTAAAAELGISRQALVAKIRRLGVCSSPAAKPPGSSAPTAPRGGSRGSAQLRP